MVNSHCVLKNNDDDDNDDDDDDNDEFIGIFLYICFDEEVINCTKL